MTMGHFYGFGLAVGTVLAEAGADIESWSVYAMEEGPAAVCRIQSNAEADGVFGVPTFFTNNEQFWGQDRLHFVEQALQ